MYVDLGVLIYYTCGVGSKEKVLVRWWSVCLVAFLFALPSSQAPYVLLSSLINNNSQQQQSSSNLLVYNHHQSTNTITTFHTFVFLLNFSRFPDLLHVRLSLSKGERFEYLNASVAKPTVLLFWMYTECLYSDLNNVLTYFNVCKIFICAKNTRLHVHVFCF